LQGLLWVYPSFKHDRGTCRRVWKPLSPRKVLVYFCPFDAENPNGGIRYSEWASASAAHEVMTTDFYWPEKDVERDGYTWSLWVREDRDEKGWFSTGIAYRDWPFSAEVVSNAKSGAIQACNFVELRSPITFHRVSGLCKSST
jgi:hypothetical protein